MEVAAPPHFSLPIVSRADPVACIAPAAPTSQKDAEVGVAGKLVPRPSAAACLGMVAAAAVGATDVSAPARRSCAIRSRRRRGRWRHGGAARAASAADAVEGMVVRRGGDSMETQVGRDPGFDHVESAVVDAVPELSRLQHFAAEFHDSELRELQEILTVVDGGDLVGSVSEVGELLRALVDSIHGLREAAVCSQQAELRNQVVHMDHEVEAWASSAKLAQVDARTRVVQHIPTMMEVHVVGVAAHAPPQLRSKLCVPEAYWNGYARELLRFAAEGRPMHGEVGGGPLVVTEAAVLSSQGLGRSGRFEIYFAAPETLGDAAMRRAVAFVSERSGLPAEQIRPYLFTKSGVEAARHLFEVASGLDSQFLGEAQPLAQVQASYQRSIQKPASRDEGCGGTTVSKLLGAAVRTGKLTRTQTNINRGAVSLPGVAAELLAKELPGLLASRRRGRACTDDVTVVEDSTAVRICIVGASGTSRLLLASLAKRFPDATMVVVGRSAQEADAMIRSLAAVVPASASVQGLGPTSLPEAVRDSSAVFVAGRGFGNPVEDLADDAAEDAVAEEEELLALSPMLLRGRRAGKLLLVDLSATQRAASELRVDEPWDGEGAEVTISAFGLCDLYEVVQRNAESRQAEVEKVRVIIDEQAEAFKVWLCSQGAVPYLVALKAKAEEIRKREIDKVSRRLSGLGEAQREAVDALTKELITKLLEPLYASIREQEAVEDKRRKIVAMQSLFRLKPSGHQRNALPSQQTTQLIEAADAAPHTTSPGTHAVGQHEQP